MELQLIQQKIYEIRGHKVMLDFDLAVLYQVKTKQLNLAVKRNIERFPSDFMFQLSDDEWKNLRFQNETSNTRGGTRYKPYAFTEHGIAMLSGILHSKIAIDINISIMRVFITIRQYALSHSELSQKLRELETKYDKQFSDIFEALNYLLQKDVADKEQKERKPIGFGR